MIDFQKMINTPSGVHVHNVERFERLSAKDDVMDSSVMTLSPLDTYVLVSLYVSCTLQGIDNIDFVGLEFSLKGCMKHSMNLLKVNPFS